MKHECPIVRDLLPLYLENMVSPETAAYIEAHLAACSDCHAEFEALRTPDALPLTDAVTPSEETQALLSVKKKVQTKTRRTSLVLAAALLVIVLLIYHFPVYHIPAVCLPTPNYYDADELAMLAYIGSVKDRRVAQGLISQAEQACEDLSLTDAQARAKYGLLSRFATPCDMYPTVVAESHSIDLWAAHLDDTEGYIWIYYSQEAYDADGETVTGSWRIPSLWYVEKNDSGEWTVTDIKEHP